MNFLLSIFLCLFCMAFATATERDRDILDPKIVTKKKGTSFDSHTQGHQRSLIIRAKNSAEQNDFSRRFEASDLIEAIIANDIHQVRFILKEGNHTDLNGIYYMEGTPIRQKIAMENIGMIQEIRAAGMTHFFSATPLVYAVQINHAEIADILIEAGALVNQPDFTGATPLHWASVTQSTDAVIVLLSHGANPYARDQLWMTPHQWTESREIKRILKKAGARRPLERIKNAVNYCRGVFLDMAS